MDLNATIRHAFLQILLWKICDFWRSRPMNFRAIPVSITGGKTSQWGALPKWSRESSIKGKRNAA